MVWLEVAVYLLKVGKSLERGQHRQGSEVKETLHRQEPKGGQMMEQCSWREGRAEKLIPDP